MSAVLSVADCGSGGGERAPLDLTLYLVIGPVHSPGRPVPEVVAAAVRGGVTCVQLRDPNLPDEEFVTLGREVASVLEGTGVPLLVNDRVHLVGAIGADGVHVGQSDTSVGEARAALGDTAYVGLSAQTLVHVDEARSSGATPDYLGVGPVWPTGSKPNAAPPGGIERLRTISAASPWPCVAIGGITTERAATLRDSGVHGIAVVSAICDADDPATAARELRAAYEGRTS